MSDIYELIGRQLQRVEYGTVSLQIKRHDSHTTMVDFQKITSHKTDTSEQALAIVIALLKAVKANKEFGSLTFTLSLEDGEATRVLVQDIQRLAG
jgi:competence protein ComGF